MKLCTVEQQINTFLVSMQRYGQYEQVKRDIFVDNMDALDFQGQFDRQRSSLQCYY